MAKQITSMEIGEFTVPEAAAIAGVKRLGEVVFYPIVGNGTVKSAAVKFLFGYLADRFLKGSTKKIVATALLVDAVEDGINALIWPRVAPLLMNAPLMAGQEEW